MSSMDCDTHASTCAYIYWVPYRTSPKLHCLFHKIRWVVDVNDKRVTKVREVHGYSNPTNDLKPTLWITLVHVFEVLKCMIVVHSVALRHTNLGYI